MRLRHSIRSGSRTHGAITYGMFTFSNLVRGSIWTALLAAGAAREAGELERADRERAA